MGESSCRHRGQVLQRRIGRDHRRADGIGLGSGRNPDSRTQYRINVRDPDRTLAIEDDLLVLTDADGAVLYGEAEGRASSRGYPTASGKVYR